MADVQYFLESAIHNAKVIDSFRGTDMELLQLHYFTETVKLKSMTKAAQFLNVSQPALTQAIHRLEKEIGIELFEKDGRGIRLTAKGQRFYGRISQPLNTIFSAAVDVHGDVLQGTVTLGTYLPLKPLLPCIKEFAEANPDVNFRFYKVTNANTLRPDMFDALLCYSQSDALGLRERRLVMTCSRRQVVPVGHTLPANGHDFVLSELADDTFASLILPGDKDEEIFSDFGKIGVMPNIRYRVNSSTLKHEILEAGLATAFSNSLLTDSFRKTGNYELYDYPPEIVTQRVVLYLRDGSVLSEAAAAFREFCFKKFPEY